MRARVLRRAGWVAAAEHHADRVDGRGHHDRRVTGQRWKHRRLAFALIAVAGGALFCVDLAAQLQHIGADQARVAGGGWLGIARCQRLEIDRHCPRIFVGEVLQAVVDDFGHRPVDRGARRHTHLQQVGKILDAPVAQPRFAARRQRRRIPVLVRNHPAFKGFGFARTAQRIDGGMAHRAMAQALHQVGAAIPLGALIRVGAELTLPEVEGAPADQQIALVVGESQFMRPVFLAHRRHRLQVGEEGVRVGAGHLGV